MVILSYLNNTEVFTLLITDLILLSLGLVMLISASASSSLQEFGTSYKLFLRQLFFAVAGLAAMWFISKFDYRIFQKFYIWAWIVSIILLIAVLIFGTES